MFLRPDYVVATKHGANYSAIFLRTLAVACLWLTIVAGMLVTLILKQWSPPAFAGERHAVDANSISPVHTKQWIKQAATADAPARNAALRTQQINSLLNVYHVGKKSFAEQRSLVYMTAAQYARVQERFLDLNDRDRLFFETHFKQERLMMLALRDSDGDGILDFRITGTGAFLANDTDADNDGIMNLFDANPQTARPIKDTIDQNDQDSDGLPDHLDWSNKNRFDFVKQEKYDLIDAQSAAFENYGIVYMQAGSMFTLALAELTMDVFNVFDGQYQKYNLRANAQSFTTARQYGVANDDVIAEVSPVNGQIIVYEKGIRNISKSTDNLMAVFMTVIHEFAHVVQNAMDYPANQQALLEQNRHLQPTVFASYLHPLGWGIDIDNHKATLPNYGYVNHDDEIFVPVEMYKNRELKTIAQICDGQHPNRSSAKRKIWKSFNGVHCYAFDGVREWHAEYVAVAVLSAMYARLQQTHGQIADKIIRRAQKKMQRDFGGESYDYKNADKKATNAIIADLNMSVMLLDRLNKKYLLEPFLTSSEFNP